MLEDAGATVKVISVPLFKYALPYHYSLLPSEAASNMARYEGIQFGMTPREFETSHNQNVLEDPQQSMFDFITTNKTITKFGQNVKRRVVLGNYLM